MSRLKFNIDGGAVQSWFVEHSKVIEVGKGSDYQYNTIGSAITASQSGDVILVHPGIYEEDGLVLKAGTHLIGVDKYACVVRGSRGDKDYTTLNLGANSSVQNMTIEQDHSNPQATEGNTAYKAYCVHADAEGLIDSEVFVDNCILNNKYHACVGIGLWQDFHIYISNTECYRYGLNPIDSNRAVGAFYWHGNTSDDVTGQRISVRNCCIKSKYGVAFKADATSETRGREVKAEYINNTLYSEELGLTDIVNTGGVLMDTCHGNNIDKLNKTNIYDGSGVAI